MILDGNCGCGVLTVQLETARRPAELPVRICGCTFCLARKPHYTSDPAGHLTITIADDAQVERYRFGLRLADFLICKRCDRFVAAVASGRAVINLDVLARATDFTAAPVRFVAYDTEDAAARTARRAANWTPMTVANLDT